MFGSDHKHGSVDNEQQVEGAVTNLGACILYDITKGWLREILVVEHIFELAKQAKEVKNSIFVISGAQTLTVAENYEAHFWPF